MKRLLSPIWDFSPGLIPRSFRRSKSIFRLLQSVWLINFWWLSPLFKKGKRSDIETKDKTTNPLNMSQIVSVTFVCMGCGVRFENFKFSRKSSVVETVHLGIRRKSGYSHIWKDWSDDFMDSFKITSLQILSLCWQLDEGKIQIKSNCCSQNDHRVQYRYSAI